MTSSEQRHQRGKGGGGNKGFKEESELGRERTFFPSEDQKAGQAHPGRVRGMCRRKLRDSHGWFQSSQGSIRQGGLVTARRRPEAH